MGSDRVEILYFFVEITKECDNFEQQIRTLKTEAPYLIT